jgi:cytoskeleton protein RodZ
MTMTPVYSLTVPGNSTIKISQDELRLLLGEIEVELHRSKVYRRALASLQKLSAASSEQAHILFKAVGREAISLAFQRFAQHHQTVADINQQVDAAVSPSVEQENSSSLASVKLHLNKTIANTSEDNLPSESKVLANTSDYSVSNPENSALAATLMKWLKPNKKPSTTEPTKHIVAEQRLEIMRQIGQQLRQARECQRLSLKQLSIYTHVSIYQMEAIENGNLDLLPEDIFVRGFIRVMGNALGINGTALAASLPIPDTAKSVLPSWYRSKNTFRGFEMEVRPMHLYVGYTALVAGAVGGLSLISQQGYADRTLNPDVVIPSSSSISQLPQKTEVTTKPGIKSSSNMGVSVGSDIAPPETL